MEVNRSESDFRLILKYSTESHEKDYCEKCGEANHLTINCFHKQAIQCHDCQMVGHKSKLCSYYH